MRARLAQRRLIRAIVALLAVTLPSVLFGVSPAWAASTITGGGSGFAGLEIQQWSADVASKPYNLTVNYQSTNSGQGRSSFASSSWDYGASDIPYPGSEADSVNTLQSQRCHGRQGTACWVYVTVTAGGLGFMYNLNSNSGTRITNLKLTPAEACQIFTGQITQWNNPQLVSTNPELGSVSQRINVITRSDAAGESYVLSEYCESVAPAVWSWFIQQSRQLVANNTENIFDSGDFFSGKPISYWPPYLGDGAPDPQDSGSDGVADAVTNGTDGASSITYDAAAYALVRGFPVASVQNAAGLFVQPNATSVQVALGYATPRGDGTFNLNFRGPDPRAYFPSTYSYILGQTGGFDPGKGATLGQFLCYAIGKGQQYAARLLYAPLSSVVVAISTAAIAQIPGAPAPSACTAGAPPPPPPPKVVPIGTPAAGSAGGLTGTSPSNATGAAGAAGSAAAGGSASAAAAAAAAAASTAATASRRGVSVTTSGAGGASTAGSSTAATQPSGSGQSPVALQAAQTSSGITNSQALLSVLEGAGLCALGLAWAGRRRGASG